MFTVSGVEMIRMNALAAAAAAAEHAAEGEDLLRSAFDDAHGFGSDEYATKEDDDDDNEEDEEEEEEDEEKEGLRGGGKKGARRESLADAEPELHKLKTELGVQKGVFARCASFILWYHSFRLDSNLHDSSLTPYSLLLIQNRRRSRLRRRWIWHWKRSVCRESRRRHRALSGTERRSGSRFEIRAGKTALRFRSCCRSVCVGRFRGRR